MVLDFGLGPEPGLRETHVQVGLKKCYEAMRGLGDNVAVVECQKVGSMVRQAAMPSVSNVDVRIR